MVVYHGDVNADAVFDPAMLSAAFGQDIKARQTPQQKRPYGQLGFHLTFLLEPGNESHHAKTRSRIKVTIPEASEKYTF